MVSTLCTVSLVQPAVPCCASPCQAQHPHAHTCTHTHVCTHMCRAPATRTNSMHTASEQYTACTYLRTHRPREHVSNGTHTKLHVHTYSTHRQHTRVCTGLHRHAQNVWAHRAHACKAYCHTWGTCRRAAQATLLPPSAPSPLLPCSTHHAELGAARWGSGPYHPHSLSTEGG